MVKKNVEIDKYLVLDLDNTLIYSKKKLKKINKIKKSIRKEENEYDVIKRPHLTIFLNSLKKLYNLVIFTSAKKKYCKNMLKLIGKENYFSEIFTRGHMINKKKRVRTIGDYKKVIIVDDNENFVANCDIKNAIIIKPFFGEQDDYALLILKEKLKIINQFNNVREGIDKVISSSIEREKRKRQNI